MSRKPEQLLLRIAELSDRDRTLIAARRGQELRMSDQTSKLEALLGAVCALDDGAIPYALIGGIAVGLHAGVPRATIDIDLAVPSTHRTRAVIDSLVAAGFELKGEHEHSINFLHRSGEPLQLAFDPQFDEMIARAEAFLVTGQAVRVIRKEDLIVMKRRAAADPGRRRSKALRDLADVELLLDDAPAEDEGW